MNTQILIDNSQQLLILHISQYLGSTAGQTYAFSNFYLYFAQPTKYCNKFEFTIFCVSCDSPYWAYRGQCDVSCPSHTKYDSVRRRCIDLLEYETQDNNPGITTNAKGYYLIKITEDDLTLENSDIEGLFSSVPDPTDNYRNGQKYSLLPNKKIIGGYNSWRYGSYQLSFNSLPTTHYQIRIFADLYLLDGWTATDEFTITIDSTTTKVTTISGLQGQQLYGLPDADYFTKLFFRIPHTSSSLDLKFQCRGPIDDSTQSSCGLTNLCSHFLHNIEKILVFVTNKCQSCDASCSSGCQVESTQCFECHYSCLSCNGPLQSNCLTCSSIFHRSLVGKKCQCDIGYADSGVGMCSTMTDCHYSCASCYKINDANSCATCPDEATTFRKAGTNSDCVCKEGYEDTGSQVCSIICHKSCATCSDNSSTGCLTCSDNSSSHRTIDSTAHTCSCDAGYQENSPETSSCQAITPCDISCSLCSAANSPNSCLACPDNATSFRTYNSATNTCQCDTGYAETDPITANCVMQCHMTCATCSASNSSSSCSTCGDNATTHRTLNGSYECKCDNGYLEQSPIQTYCIALSPCHYSCDLCSSVNDSNACVSCPDNSVSHRILSGSACQCDSGY